MKRILLAIASAFLVLAGSNADAWADCGAAPLGSTDDLAISFLAGQGGTQAAPSSQLASSVKKGTLVYDSAADQLKICDGTNWLALAAGGTSTLAGLSDVTLTTPANGEFLKFNGTAWVNSTVSIPAGVAGTDKQLQFNDGGSTLAGATQLLWDKTNNRLTLGTTTPGNDTLSVTGTASVSGNAAFDTNTLFVDAANNRVGMGTALPAYFLHVYRGSGTGATAVISNNQANGGLSGAALLIENREASGIGDASTVYRVPSTDWFTGLDNSVGQSFRIAPQAEPSTVQTGLTIKKDGSVGIGNSSPAVTALLDLTSTTQGFLPPRMTTTQRDAIATPATGLTIYNTTTSALNVYDGTAWVAVGAGSGGTTKGFSVTASTTSLANNVGTDVVFTGTATNEFGSGWDGTTFTVPTGEGGWYVLTGGLQLAAGASNTDLIASLVAGGTSCNNRDLNDSDVNSHIVAVTCIRKLSAGDTVKLQGSQQSGSSKNLGSARLDFVKIANASGSSGGSATVTGTTKEVQFNNAGALAGATKLIWDETAGNLALGTTSSAAASALLDLTSTTQGFLPPRMTTAQRDAISSPATGLTVYNTTTSALNFYTGSAWAPVTTSSAAPAFSVHKNNVAQSISANTWSKLTWTTELFDTNNNFSSDRFTPTVPGKYVISVGVYCVTTGECDAGVYKNGSLYSAGWDDAGRSALTVVILDMNGTTDYVEGYAWSAGTSIGGQIAYTYMSGALLGGGGSGGGSATVTGTTKEVQFNNAGALAGATKLIWDETAGNLALGTTSSAAASALLDLTSTTQGFLPPRMTTTQRDAISSPATGLTVYNTTTNAVNVYTGSAWVALSAVGVIQSANTVVSGWPDALKCNKNDGTVIVFNYVYSNASVAGYRLVLAGGDPDHYITFSTDGSYSSASSYVTSNASDCINKSIAQFYAAGQAFNFVGGATAAAGGAAGNVQFNEGGNVQGDTALHWDNTNKRLGIGTTTPAQKLHISGGSGQITSADGWFLRLESPNAASGKRNWAILDNNEAGIFAIKPRNDDWSNPGDTRAFFIDHLTGNVGIGTSTPASKLEVYGPGSGSLGSIMAKDSADTDFTFIDPNYGLTLNRSTAYVSNSNVGGSLILRTSNAASFDTSAMVLTASGNVGIGTTPTSTLELYSATAPQLTAALTDAGSRGSILALNGASSSAGSGGAITFGNSQSKTAVSLGYAAIKGLLTNGANNTVGDIAFSARGASTDTALTERMRITSAGKVGIGTTAPATELEVVGTTTTNAINISNTNSTYGNPIKITGVGGVEDDIVVFSYGNTANGGGIFSNKARGTEASPTAVLSGDALTYIVGRGYNGSGWSGGGLYQRAEANFSGTVTDTYWYFTNTYDAAVKTTFKIASTGITTVYGTSTCVIGSGTGTTSCTSDRRLKTDIKPLQGALDKITALEGVNFKWKTDPSLVRIGLIAQDVEKQFPEVVSTDPETGMKSVAYASLVAPLVEAVKQLKTMFDDLSGKVVDVVADMAGLNDRVSALEAENAALKTQMDAMKADIEALKAAK